MFLCLKNLNHQLKIFVMRHYIISVFLIICGYSNAQISPFTEHDWTIEKIETVDGSIILADANQQGHFDKMIIWYEDFIFVGYRYLFSECEGRFNFEDSNQSYYIQEYGCAVTPNHTTIADHFVNIFILEEGGEIMTEEGPVYGPFSYDFRYSDDLVYLDITNLEGSIATFYATNLSQEDFLKDSIGIYPNPVTAVLTIESLSVAIDNIKIYDLRGRLVEQVIINDESQINVSQLQKGIYMIEIKTSMGVLRKKLIKQ